MSKRYIVALDSSTIEQNDAMKDFVRENGLGWWYWINDFWLLTDPREKFSASEIRDVVGKTHPKTECLVIELNDYGDTWSGFGPKSEYRNMFTWLKKTWSKYK